MSGHSERRQASPHGAGSARRKPKKEPELVMVKTIHEMDREELETILEGIRLRRIAAATEYIRGKNEKIGREIGKLVDRLRPEYDMLEKELASLDRAMEKCEKRIV